MEPKDNIPENNSCDNNASCAENNQQANEQAEQAKNEQETSNTQQAPQPLQSELDLCKAVSEQWQQRYIQLSADMQNYKRRMEREQLAWTRRAQETVLVQLLPIVDDFDRALAEHKKHAGDQELSAWITGFEMISKELYKFLKNVHVTEIAENKILIPYCMKLLHKLNRLMLHPVIL